MVAGDGAIAAAVTHHFIVSSRLLRLSSESPHNEGVK